MKKLLAVLLTALAAANLSAQRINPDSFRNEFSLGTGLGAVLDGGESDATFWLNYSHYYNRHVGVRAGLQYMPSNAGIDGFYGAPIALSLRTGMFDYSNYGYGAMLAVDALDALFWNSDNIFLDMLAIFLLSTINRGELFLGLTPAYIAGKDNIRTAWYTGMDGNTYEEYHGTRKAGSLYCSADMGVNFSWRIWRFTLNLSPVFHWNFTGNYHIYSASEGTTYPQDTPIRWTFNLNFGLGWLF